MLNAEHTAPHETNNRKRRNRANNYQRYKDREGKRESLGWIGVEEKILIYFHSWASERTLSASTHANQNLWIFFSIFFFPILLWLFYASNMKNLVEFWYRMDLSTFKLTQECLQQFFFFQMQFWKGDFTFWIKFYRSICASTKGVDRFNAIIQIFKYPVMFTRSRDILLAAPGRIFIWFDSLYATMSFTNFTRLRVNQKWIARVTNNELACETNERAQPTP